jgi:hypothetical protein
MTHIQYAPRDDDDDNKDWDEKIAVCTRYLAYLAPRYVIYSEFLFSLDVVSFSGSLWEAFLADVVRVRE